MSTQVMPQSTMILSGPQTTPFGAVENPFLEQYLLNTSRNILRVDLLVALQELWGDNIMRAREPLYKLVSGSCTDSQFQHLLSSNYKRFSAFANFVDERFLFGDQSVPLASRVIAPARAAIEAYKQKACRLAGMYHGTKIGEHHDYLYLMFRDGNIPNIVGGETIC